MRVQVAYAAPGVETLVEVELGAGAVLADAVQVSGLVQRLRLPADTLSYAIHGHRASADTTLRDGDRVEILRPLLADPKTVRRRRAAAHPLPRPAPRSRKTRSSPKNSG